MAFRNSAFSFYDHIFTYLFSFVQVIVFWVFKAHLYGEGYIDIWDRSWHRFLSGFRFFYFSFMLHIITLLFLWDGNLFHCSARGKEKNLG